MPRRTMYTLATDGRAGSGWAGYIGRYREFSSPAPMAGCDRHDRGDRGGRSWAGWAVDAGSGGRRLPARGDLGERFGMVPFGNAYLMVAEDGGIFNFSNRAFSGSLGADPPADPITSVAVLG